METNELRKRLLEAGSALQVLALVGAGAAVTGLASAPAAAQDYTSGAITGTVTDSNGAPVSGATVTLTDEDDKTVRYQLVGQAEADARVGRISYNSPLGRALIGRQAGEEVEVSTPSGDRYYGIEKLEFI